jgi:hypothetical protein
VRNSYENYEHNGFHDESGDLLRVPSNGYAKSPAVGGADVRAIDCCQ